MDKLRAKIYEYFDDVGIKGQIVYSLVISFDVKSLEPGVNTPKKFIPPRNVFDLSEEEYCRYVVEYVYETTGIDIVSANNIDQFSSLNGLPFIVKLEGSRYFEAGYSLAFGKINGNLRIDNKEITSLGNIEEINGDISFISSTLSSLGKLKKVSGSFLISYHPPHTTLTDLNDLEFVGHNLNLQYSPIKNLSKLKYVGKSLILTNTKIESLGSLEEVKRNLILPKELKGKIDVSKVKVGGKIRYFKD